MISKRISCIEKALLRETLLSEKKEKKMISLGELL